MLLQTPWFLALCVFGRHAAAETLLPRDNGHPDAMAAVAAAAADCTTRVTRTVTIPPTSVIVITTTILSFVPCHGCDLKLVTKTVQADGGWGHGKPPISTTTTITAFACSAIKTPTP